MGMSLVEKAVVEFLASDKAEVLCIRGKWGTGKTFAWTTWFGAAVAKKKVKLKRYSYCSLFGVGSLAELKGAIVQHTIDGGMLDTEPTVATYAKGLAVKGLASGSTIASKLADNVGVKGVGELIGPGIFLLVRRQIVCIDDIERKGRNLDVSDVLGLTSYLKEHRSCKVVLVLNDEALHDKEDFERYLEKVVDKSLSFSPSASECADIVLGENNLDGHLKSCCVQLGIRNIRVIQRIKAFADILLPKFSQYDIRAQKQVLTMLVVLCWATYMRDEAPPLEFLANPSMERARAMVQKIQLSEDQRRWHRLMDEVGFHELGEVGKVIRDGVRDGFFDEAALEDAIRVSDRFYRKIDLEQAIHDSWEAFHSFSGTAASIAEGLARSIANAVEIVSPQTLDTTVSLLKRIGHRDKALRLIELYVENRGGDTKAFELPKHSVISIRDSDVIAAFVAASSQQQQESRSTSVLDDIVGDLHLTSERLSVLRAIQEHEFFVYFKKGRPQSVGPIVQCCLAIAKKDFNDPLVVSVKGAVERLLAEDAVLNRVRLFDALVYLGLEEPPGPLN